jgi:hypothetical protein
MIKRILLISVFVLISKISFAQYASIEASTGGFSFIPAFASKDPHFIATAGTSSKHRLSAHLLTNLRMENGVPRNLVIISRYRLIDQKLKMNVGVYIPAFQITDDYTVNSFFSQDVTVTYPISESVTIGTFYLHGKGRNFDHNSNFLSLNTTVVKGKMSFLTQAYVLDMDNTYGMAETLAYKLSDQFSLKAFATKIISSGEFKWTVGVKYNL